MKNEKLVLETLENLLANSAGLIGLMSGFSMLLANRIPGLSEREIKTLQAASQNLLEMQKTQESLLMNLKIVLRSEV